MQFSFDRLIICLGFFVTGLHVGGPAFALALSVLPVSLAIVVGFGAGAAWAGFVGRKVNAIELTPRQRAGLDREENRGV